MTLPIHGVLLPLAVAAPVNGAVNVLLHIEAKLVRRTRSAVRPLMRSFEVFTEAYSP